MAIEGISAEALLKQMGQLQNSTNVNDKMLETGKTPEGAESFDNVLGNLIKDVDKAQKDADVSLQKLATGETTSIQEVVLKMEEASISFSLMKEIRDKLLTAYKDILTMQS